MSLACPACGAGVKFRTQSAVSLVCSYCKQLLVRQNMNLEAVGKMADLQSQDEVSPLQLGTRGKFDGKLFDIVGRLRQSWEDGAWNEWYILFSDRTEGWLAEAQGFFMVSFRDNKTTTAPPAPQDLMTGQTVRIRGIPFKVDDIKASTCTGSEGELPFPAPVGRKSMSADLSTPEGTSFATIDFSANEGLAVYIGRFVEFDQLELRNIREIEGWPLK